MLKQFLQFVKLNVMPIYEFNANLRIANNYSYVLVRIERAKRAYAFRIQKKEAILLDRLWLR